MYKTQAFWAAYSEMPVGWHIRTHSHTFFHLAYLRSGSIVFRSSDEVYPLSKGSLIIFPPGVVHETTGDSQTLCNMYEVKFHILDDRLRALWDNGKVFCAHHVSQFESILQYISYHWCVNGTHVSDIIDSFLCTILFSLTATEADYVRSAYITTSGYSQLTKRIINHIESNYMEPYRLDHLAEILEYNKNYMCTAFRKDTGITIVDYLTYVRVRRVLSWMYYLEINSDTKINTLSQCVGYQNSSHFNRVFKKMTGTTPSKYAAALISEGHELGVTKLAKYYEEHLGLRILPLHQSLENMRKLGEAME